MDKAFKFKLDKVLDIRKSQEEEKKIVFMEANNEVTKVKQELRKLEDTYDKYSRVDLNSSVVERKLAQTYLNLLDSTINTTAEVLEEKKKGLNTARKELISAQIDRKTVEILKDKSYEKFIREQNRIEQNQNDEFALYGFVRNNRR